MEQVRFRANEPLAKIMIPSSSFALVSYGTINLSFSKRQGEQAGSFKSTA